MSLKLYNPGHEAVGRYDGYDLDLASVLGGEVGTLIGVPVTGTDLAASDADGTDGYVGAPPAHTRPAVTKTLASGSRPLGLLDDGIAGYGTLFGSVVGGTAGQVATGGAVIGPHSALGSGKITFHDKPGLYGVSLDAVDTTASTGLVTTNTGLTVGDPLYATTAGLLTPNSGVAFESVVVGHFAEFETNGSLVNTPVHLISAPNSPVGGNPQPTALAFAVFHFAPNV